MNKQKITSTIMLLAVLVTGISMSAIFDTARAESSSKKAEDDVSPLSNNSIHRETRMGEIIGGTVIQRSFVGRESANIIHVATVPLAELGMDTEEPRTVVSELLGIPRSNVLDQEDYGRILERLRRFPPDYFFPFWHPRSDRYFQKVFNSLEGKKEEGNKELLTDFLATVSGATALANLIQPWPFHLTDGDSK
jgi:hypothetical protein